MRLALILFCWFAFFSTACEQQQPGTVIGEWQEKSGAAWEFTADGHVIIRGDASPTYNVIDDRSLVIEFHTSQNLAVTYTYELSENKLILNPEEASGEGALPRDWDTVTVLVRPD